MDIKPSNILSSEKKPFTYNRNINDNSLWCKLLGNDIST